MAVASRLTADNSRTIEFANMNGNSISPRWIFSGRLRMTKSAAELEKIAEGVTSDIDSKLLIAQTLISILHELEEIRKTASSLAGDQRTPNRSR